MDHARPHSAGWAAIAERLRLIERQGAWRQRYPTRLDWFHALKRELGCTPSTIQRFLDARKFLDQLAQERPEYDLKVAFCSPERAEAGIAALEILKRIHDVAPHRVNEILPQVIAGSMTVREIRQFYDKVALTDPQGTPEKARLGQRTATAFANNAVRAIKAQLRDLTHASGVIGKRRPKFGCVQPTYVAIKGPNPLVFVDAFDARYVRHALTPALLRLLIGEITFSATRFRHYWLVLPRRSELTAQLSAELAPGGYRSIGIAELNGKTRRLNVMIEPSGPPTPDNRHLVRQFLTTEARAA